MNRDEYDKGDLLPWDQLGKNVEHPFEILAKEVFEHLLPEQPYDVDYAIALALRCMCNKFSEVDHSWSDDFAIRLRKLMTPYLMGTHDMTEAEIERSFPV